MDFADSRFSRNLLTVFVVVTAAVVVWVLLKSLFTFVPGMALPLLLITAIFLIVLVLIQRGKGGGLAGAFGGMGGQSAFGTKAGDLFTRVTIGFLCTLMTSLRLLLMYARNLFLERCTILVVRNSGVLKS